MDVEIRKVPEEDREVTVIECHEVTPYVREIATFVKSRQGQLTCTREGQQYEVPIADILYVESVDSRTFLYTSRKTYESRQKIYQLEELLAEKQYVRISKSMLLNLMKVKSIKPAMNGRFCASLSNGEEIIISRKYVPSLKQALREN